MQLLYRCEYCDKIGVADVIAKHENECIYNRTKRSCFTCKYAKSSIRAITCTQGKSIEAGHYYSDCDVYEWDSIDHTTSNPIAVNGVFGGALF